MIIVLDAGHGYQTAGKQSPDGMLEYEFNQKVAQYVKDDLTNCPSILIECGFMTNKREAALLKSDPFRQKCGQAIAASMIEYYQLQQKETEESLYKVQIGAFKDKKNAEALVEQLKKLGYEAFITK